MVMLKRSCFNKKINELYCIAFYIEKNAKQRNTDQFQN